MDPDHDLEDRFHEALAEGAASEILRIADELQRASEFRRSRELLKQAWAALPTEPRIAERLLEIHSRYHKWTEFDALAKQALAAHPDHGELYFTMGCGYEARRDWPNAWRAFSHAARLAPEEVEPVLRMARCYRMARKTKDAIGILNKSLRRHPRSAPLRAALGYAYIQDEQPTKAVRCFERAVELQPDWGPYLDDLAGSLMLCERWPEAARVAQLSLTKRKQNERAWTVYAIAHNKLGNPKFAEQGYRNAIRAARNPSRARGNYGLFLAKLPERLLEAVRLLREAQEAHPDWTEVSEKLELLLEADG